MAQGIFLGQNGNVRTLVSCYVGAGGLKEVTQVYVGQNGSPRLVWAPSIYSNGSFGPLCGSGGTCLYWSSSYTYASFEASSINIHATNNESTGYGGAVFDSTLNTGDYNSLSAEFVINTVPTSTTYDVDFGVGLYTTKPESAYQLHHSSYTAYYSELTINNLSTNVTYTCTLDMSSITGSYYVGVYVYCNRMRTFDLDVKEVYVR